MGFVAFKRIFFGSYEKIELHFNENVSRNEAYEFANILKSVLSDMITKECEVIHTCPLQSIATLSSELQVIVKFIDCSGFILVSFNRGYDLVAMLFKCLKKLSIEGTRLIELIITSGYLTEGEANNPAITYSGTNTSIFHLKLTELERLNKKTANLFKREGYVTISDLMFLTKKDICRIRNFGRKGYINLYNSLTQLGFSVEPYE